MISCSKSLLFTCHNVWYFSSFPHPVNLKLYIFEFSGKFILWLWHIVLHNRWQRCCYVTEGILGLWIRKRWHSTWNLKWNWCCTTLTLKKRLESCNLCNFISTTLFKLLYSTIAGVRSPLVFLEVPPTLPLAVEPPTLAVPELASSPCEVLFTTLCWKEYKNMKEAFSWQPEIKIS